VRYRVLRHMRCTLEKEENNGIEVVPLKKRGAVLFGYTLELMIPAEFPTEKKKPITAARVYIGPKLHA
jgi:hypothetical protein